MLSPARLDLVSSGPHPAALSTVAHFEKTYIALSQRTYLAVLRHPAHPPLHPGVLATKVRYFGVKSAKVFL